MSTRKVSGDNKLKRYQKETANQSRREAFHWLSETFPEAFDTTNRIRPLKVGIMNDVLKEAQKRSAPFSKSKLKQVVAMFANRLEYLACLKLKRDDRIDLEGTVVGVVTDAQGLAAANALKKRVDKMTRDTLNEEKKSKDKKKETKITPSYPYRPQPKIETPTQKAPQIVVKRKVTPEKIARMREKLGLPKEKA